MTLCFLFSALIVALDQIFKQWILRTIPLNEFGPDIIPGVLGLMHYENDGAMLNILSGQQWLLAGIAFVASVVLIMILLRYDEGFWGTLGLASVLGGTVGNLCDRVFNDGKVIDMFRTLFIQFPIFNFADVFITLGFLIFLAHFISLTIKSAQTPPSAPQRTRADIIREEESEIDLDEISQIKNFLPSKPAQDEQPAEQPYVVYDESAALEPQHIETYEEPVYAHSEPAVEYTEPVEETVVPPETYIPDDTYSAEYDITSDISIDSLGINLDDIDVDYDVDDLLREYGLDDNDTDL